MKHFIFFLLLLLGACEPALESNQFGDEDPMSRRTLENKPVHEPAQLTPVVAVTPAHGWWSGSNNVGTETAFAPDANLRQTILSLPEIGAPEEWTISLYMTFPPAVGASLANFRVTAVIQFGAGGSTQIVEVDWLNGAQITLPCNAINVIAQYSNGTAGVGVRLGVQVARGRRGGNQPPRKTVSDFTIIDPSGSAQFVIPAFASRIRVVPSDVPSVPVLYNASTFLILRSSPGGGSFLPTTISGAQLLANDGLEVIGAARILQIDNTDAVNRLDVAVFADLFG